MNEERSKIMKYLLVGVNAKYIHSNLAIRCLASYSAKYAVNTPVVREFTINMPVSDIIRKIYSEAPDFIAFSVYIWNIDIIMQIVSDIKILLPDVIIYLGGPEVSYESEALLNRHPEITGIMLGEGEQTLTDIINHYDTGSVSLHEIPGLCYRDNANGSIITTSVRLPIDLSLVPFPYDNLSDLDNKIIYYETSRGCPFGCSYCLSSVDKTLRFRNMNLVRQELKVFLDARVPQVKLVDRTFNIDHKRSLEILDFLKSNDNGITNFHFEIAGDILTQDEIELINSLRPGLIQLEIGVQSTNPCTLESINRRTDLEKLGTNVALLLAGGRVHLHLDLIAGLPFEDISSFKKSFNEVYSMHSHELQLGFLKVLKGAPINDMTDSQNIQHQDRAPYEVLSTKYLSYNDICELKRVEEMLEIYHNSCQFTNCEQFLLDNEASPYDLYYNLSQFYIKKAQPVVQCKRAVRYELLLEYVIEKYCLDDEKIRNFKVLLTIDYFSRERAKARPSYAIPLDSYKSQLRELDTYAKSVYQSGLYHIEPLAVDDEYILFDYSDRSPITGNASTRRLSYPI